MIKIEMSDNELMIFNESGEYKDFLGNATFSKVEEYDNVYEILTVVARPKFGKLLYDVLLMAANNEGFYICSSRDGDTRSAAFNNWERISKDNKVIKKDLEVISTHELSSYFEKEEVECLYKAYSKKPTKGFKKAFKKLNSAEDSILKKEEQKDFRNLFLESYDNDGNKFIDEYYPLSKKVDCSYIMEDRKKIKNKI